MVCTSNLPSPAAFFVAGEGASRADEGKESPSYDGDFYVQDSCMIEHLLLLRLTVVGSWQRSRSWSRSRTRCLRQLSH